MIRISIVLLFIVLLIILLVSACYTSPSDSEATMLSPSSTISPSVIPTQIETPGPTIAQTPVPSLAPTAKPFSFYAPTVDMSFEELVGDDGYYEFPKGFPEEGTYRIIVDTYYQVVMIYTNNGKGEYTVPVRYMLCSTGLNDRTPTGAFKMMNYHVRFGLLKSIGLYSQYWSQIRNRIYFHSILYSEKDASTYVEETYTKLGQPDTPGCIYLSVPDARWIYYNIAPDTEIEIREGSADDEETALIRSQLVLIPAPKSRVQLEKGNIPNTDNWSVEEIKNEVPFLQGCQK